MFCFVFYVLNAIFIWMSLNNFVIFLISFLLYVNVAHLVVVLWVYVSILLFLLWGWVFYDFSHICCYVLCSLQCLVFSFASLDIGYMFNLFTK
jgi:hypothetical protein